MSQNSFFKRRIRLSEPFKKKVLVAMIAFYSLAAAVFIFGFGICQWVAGGQSDEFLRYSENHAFGKGINPFSVMDGVVIKECAGTVPYNFIFYYLFHFSDSDINVAMSVAFCLYLIAICASAFVIFKFAMKNTLRNVRISLLLVLIFLGQFGVGACLGIGNYGIYTYFFILVLAYTDFFEKHSVAGGIALGLGMAKPQTMTLFFVPLVLGKRYLLVAVSVFTVAGAYLCACFAISAHPVELFSDFSGQGIRATNIMGHIYCGIWGSTWEFFSGNPRTDLLGISFIVFLAFAFVMSWRFGNMENMYAYLIPAAISTIWTYSCTYNSTGIYILWAVPIVLDFFAREKISIGRLLLYIGVLAAMVFYLPRKTLGLPNELFPFSEDLYRLFMVFAAFFIAAKRNTFITDYGKISGGGRKILQKV